MSILGIFAFYNKRGEVNTYVRYLLKEIKKDIKDIVIVCNGGLREEGRNFFIENAQELFIRQNEGFDAGAYQDVILNKMGLEKIKEYDALLLFNNSFYGPIFSFHKVFEEMWQKNWDFWGITAGQCNINNNTPYHIQSYFLMISGKILCDRCFEEYWKTQEKCNTLYDAIEKFEKRFTEYFLDRGYTCGTYIDLNEIGRFYDKPGNLLSRLELELIRDWNCPVLKRKYIMMEETEALYQNNVDILGYIKENTTYDVDMIWEDLIEEYTPYELNSYRCIRYIISPTHPSNDKEDKAVIIIYSAYYRCYLEFLNQFLKNAEVIVIVNREEERNEENKYNCRYVVKGEKSFLYVFKKLLQEYHTHSEVCIVSGNLKNENIIDVKRYITDICYKLLYSDGYIMNVRELFSKNKRLGLLLSEPMCQFEYFAKMGKKNKLTKKHIETLRLLQCDFESILGERILENAGCFWCRPHIFDALFLGNHSNLSEAEEIFDVLPYLTRKEGFYTGIVNNAETMRKEYALKCQLVSEVYEKINLNTVYFDLKEGISNLIKNGIEDFVRKYEAVYIYGAGAYGKKCLEVLKSNNVVVLGFVVSENTGIQRFMDYVVWGIDEIQLKKNEAIIVAMNEKNQKEVLSKLKSFPDEKIYYI